MTPARITCEDDGTGSAAFDYRQIVALVGECCCREIDRALGRSVDLLGVRFVDALGRDVDGPVFDGVALVGFRFSAPDLVDARTDEPGTSDPPTNEPGKRTP